MKCFVIIFSLCVFLLLGCHVERIEVPESNSSYLLVAHVKEEMLSFIDIHTNELYIEGTSPVSITDLAYVGNGKVLLTSESEASVMELDLQEGTLSPFIELNQGLTALLYDKQDWFYVADTINHTIHRVSISDQKVIGDIDIGAYPVDLEHGVNELFVLSGDEHKVTVVDKELQQSLMTFSVVERPAGMYFDGERLWVGGHGPYGDLNQMIYAYDPESGELLETLEVGLMPIAFYADETSPNLYVLCHGEHAIYQIDQIANEVVDVLPVGQNPNQVIGNKEHLYVSNLDGDSITVIERDSFEVVAELPVAAGPYAMVLGE
ncbi:YncE family protein [Bacillus sp. JCM 19034]|uniref:YncE family protein n=1 Tax=Bacillus sp. JCM 19034 TaxID=1481928 RepID=UPI00078359CA|nr:hypothetical protein [Bacillus sp. JCM 19034]